MINPTITALELEQFLAPRNGFSSTTKPTSYGFSTEFNDESKSVEENIVIVYCWTPWCQPCKKFSQLFSRIAKKTPLINFVNINIAKETAFAESFKIRSIPYLLIFKQGILVYSEGGSVSEASLQTLVIDALAVDIGKLSNK